MGLQGNIDKNTSPYLIGDYKNETILNNEETSISISGAPNARPRGTIVTLINGLAYSNNHSGLMVGSIDTPNNGAGNWE